MTLAIPSQDPRIKPNRVEMQSRQEKQIQPSQKTTNIASVMAKNTLDVLVCLILIPLLVPVMLAIGLAILLDSRGPVLFKQKRIGQNGKPFTIYKFRTMTHKFDDSKHRAYMQQYISGQAEQEGDSFKPPSASQITKVGAILRSTSLDELPQLINVIRGEMSIVGPRPNVVWEVEAYEAWHRKRLAVKPGITGWAQVNGRSSITFDELVKYDIEYVNNQSLALDIKIMVQTVTEVLKRSGAG